MQWKWKPQQPFQNQQQKQAANQELLLQNDITVADMAPWYPAGRRCTRTQGRQKAAGVAAPTPATLNGMV
jgi:hypothetical protein